MTAAAPKGVRLHIAFFGRRNVGKSSLINALTGQAVSIVSEVAGTTTDPVEKAMELQPIGPVLLIDTAGLDDVGVLGKERVDRTRGIFDRTDIGILVATDADWGEFEEQVLTELARRKAAAVVAFNKSDLTRADPLIADRLRRERVPCVRTVATTGEGIAALRETLIRATPEPWFDHTSIVGDLVPPGQLIVLVVPIDLEAPKGRLILPQVQTIRDILDSDAYCLVVKERELRDALGCLNRPPALVVTDSQAFLKVAGDVPNDVMLTSFSILFARYKGDLLSFVRGALAIDQLRSGDRVLLAEACAHHPLAEDIGRVKIPRWLTQYVGGHLEFKHAVGHEFPPDLADYRLVVHCGACTQNRREVLSRVERCRQAGVPITNYGMTIAYSLGIFERALRPFPAALDLYKTLRHQRAAGRQTTTQTREQPEAGPS